MARQIKMMESGNIVVDLTTDDCNEAILPKVPVNSGDSDVKPSVITLTDINDTEDDVEFLGIGVRYVPVITISESDVFENDNINSSNTRSYTLKANSTSTVKNLLKQSEGCTIMEGKSYLIEKTESQQMKSMRISERAKKVVAETVVGSACKTKRHYTESSKHNKQVQNIKKEILTEGGSPQNKICKRSIRNGYDENGTKMHRKKPKIKVRIMVKKPGSGINTQHRQDTPITDEVKTEDSRNPKPYCMASEGVTRKGIQDISTKTVNQGILTQNQLTGSENTVNKEYLDLKKESCSSEISYKVNVCKKDTIKKSVAKRGIGENVRDGNKKLSKIEDSDPWHQTESNAGCENNKRIREIHEKTSSDNPEESSTACSQLAIRSAALPLHNAQGERDGSHNKNIEATISDEQNGDSTLEVQLLPARMTIKDCESQVVYAVPLLRLPVQKQIIYFSPAYIEVFLKKVRDIFSVERFLRVIPDPFNYFRNEISKENRYSDECLALMYLKSKYRRIPFPDIAFIFEKNRCSLTLTCEELDMWKSSWKRTVRKIGLGCGCPKPHELSMRFVHEVTFIENKNIIGSHLQSKKRKKGTALEIAKLRGELQQCGHCGICDLLIEDMAPCSVSHMFCKICIQNAVDSRLLRCENPFSCLNKGCQWLFSMEELKKAVKPVTFSSLLHIRHLKEMEAAGVKLLETCPYCGFADIPSKDDEVFCCLNLDCMRETCRQCKGSSHTPYPCVMALRPQVEMPRLVTNRCDQYQNQFQSTETQQNIGIVQEKSLVLQQPQPLMQYPQQPLIYQQPLMYHPQEPLMNHQQPLMHHPLEPIMHHQQPLMAPQDDRLTHYPQQPLVHHLQSPAVQQSWPPFIPEEQMTQHYQPPQWRS